ncbi:MAG: DNA/RNA non-specific endonuclease [Oscillospiraceae bacterium]|nr:DNA/RNA non-specific endonuclease [Candidatus Equicaccousia limihippi]
MKKTLSLIIALMLCVLVCACTTSTAPPVSSVPSQISSVVVTSDAVSSGDELSHGDGEISQSNPEEGQNYDKKAVSSANKSAQKTAESILNNIPSYNGKAYISLNGGKPLFGGVQSKKSFESYSPLDSLGRCGVAFACIGKDLMPTEKRGDIGMIKPTGWQTVKYDCVDGKYLYNRCHLIGFQLSGENANKRNLITGTRYLNIEGMLPFENMVADYVKESGNHVLYRVTPIFKGNNLLASGVTIEGWSVEDGGKEICFYVYCYNVQPNIYINYTNGGSSLDPQKTSAAAVSSKKATVSKTAVSSKATAATAATGTYILNTSTKKFHYASCSSAKQIADKNKSSFKGNRQNLISQGYEPCKKCNP